MCGIAGCISNEGKIDRGKFNKMVDIISHRGPDDRGTFFENNLALGHRRLSIIDLSRDGHQPFFYNDEYIIVFNGEIYNYLELKEYLVQKGYHFRTRTDTEALIASYCFWGEECVEHFNGMWSFAIYDRKKHQIFCSRDRFGVKPFYYTEQEGLFLFASEIKQFFEMLEKNPKANKDTLLQFIIRGNMDYSAETMFKDIYQLPGGYNLIYNLKEHTWHIKQYYDIRKIHETKIDYEEACKQFRDKFYDSVNLRLRSDVPLGYCLSGGLDSSAIVCMADNIVKNRGGEEEQHTISSCFEDKRYDEQEYIDEVVEHTSVISHKVFPEETDLFNLLDDIIWHMDEPFGSTSIYAQWNVFKAAQDCQLKVMLDGQGADEQLAGYTNFYMVMFADCLKKGQIKKFLKERKIYKKNRAITELHISSKKIVLSAIGTLIIPNRYFLKRLYYSFSYKRLPFTKKQLYQALKSELIYPVQDARDYIAESMRNGMASLLHFEDRDSMAHSIESRVPFLDYQLAEMIYAMPFDHKLREGITKAMLRDGLKDILPEKIRTRYSKLGFVTPEEQWINNNFDKYKEELAEAVDALSQILEPDRVMKWFDENEGKIKRQDFTPWRIICAGHWAKLFHVSFE